MGPEAHVVKHAANSNTPQSSPFKHTYQSPLKKVGEKAGKDESL